MTRHYHRQDIANSSTLYDGFEPIPEYAQDAYRYGISQLQIDRDVCRSYFRYDDQIEFIAIHNPTKGKMYIVERWSDSPEKMLRPGDTPLMYDERTVDSDTPVQYIVPKAGGGESLLSMDDRRSLLPESRFTPAALAACAKNGIRAYRQYEYRSVRDLGYADSEAAIGMLYDRIREFWAFCADQREMEREQSLEAGRGDGFGGSGGRTSGDTLGDFLP